MSALIDRFASLIALKQFYPGPELPLMFSCRPSGPLRFSFPLLDCVLPGSHL